MPGSAIQRIEAERVRQVTEEGFTADEDDLNNEPGDLATAAVAYTQHAIQLMGGPEMDNPPWDWPWDTEFWKPTDEVRDLEKAGALIAAELDRVLREKGEVYPE